MTTETPPAFSLDDVYRKFGAVAEAAQLLETELGNLLLLIHGAEWKLYLLENRDKAVELHGKINKSTLGQLLRKVGDKTDPEHVTSLFEKALEARNRLSHSFYRHHNFRRNSDEGRKIMLADLESMHEIILDAWKAADALSGTDSAAFKALGLPIQQVDLD